MKTTKSSLRRQQNRRQQERRNLNLKFNSPEWIEYMQSHFLLWPKMDRRQRERRSSDRRASERRQPKRALTQPQPRYSLTTSDLLSDEEKQMIQNLFLNKQNP